MLPVQLGACACPAEEAFQGWCVCMFGDTPQVADHARGRHVPSGACLLYPSGVKSQARGGGRSP